MSLDVYLVSPTTPGVVTCACGHEHSCPIESEGVEVYWANITHNLGKMADAAGIYYALWRPDGDVNGTTSKRARDIAPLLRAGLEKLKADPEHFQKFNASNGWGLYEHFVPFVEKYLAACEEYPDALVRVSR